MKTEVPESSAKFVECCGVVSVQCPNDRERRQMEKEFAFGHSIVFGIALLLLVPILWFLW